MLCARGSQVALGVVDLQRNTEMEITLSLGQEGKDRMTLTGSRNEILVAISSLLVPPHTNGHHSKPTNKAKAGPSPRKASSPNARCAQCSKEFHSPHGGKYCSRKCYFQTLKGKRPPFAQSQEASLQSG